MAKAFAKAAAKASAKTTAKKQEKNSEKPSVVRDAEVRAKRTLASRFKDSLCVYIHTCIYICRYNVHIQTM